jgi:hypothetical protein
MAELARRQMPRRHLRRARHTTMARQISRMRGEQSTASVDKLVGKRRALPREARHCVLRAGLPEI